MIVFSNHLNVETFLSHRWCTLQCRVKIFGHIYIAYKEWLHWKPVDIDYDEIGEEDEKWDDDMVKDLEIKNSKLREFNRTYGNKSIDMTMTDQEKLKHDIIELVPNQIYDKLTIYFNDTRKRLGIQKGKPMPEPIRNYYSFDLEDDGEISFVSDDAIFDLGNINGILKPPSYICRLGVATLKSMGFTNITDEDVRPYRDKYVKKRDKLRKLDENLDKRLKAIESPSTTNAEVIEMIEMTSKDIDTSIKGLEQDTSFIKPNDKDKLLPLRELEGLGKQLRTIKGPLKVAIAKRVDLKVRIEHEERKLGEIQDPSYSDDQRNMIEDRLKRLRDELNERNEEIDILKGEASKQINQIRESITEFLDKETGTLGERIRTLFKEQGITIVSILTALGMTLGVLIGALLGGPSASTPTSGSISGGDKKGGAREWIKNKLKAVL